MWWHGFGFLSFMGVDCRAFGLMMVTIDGDNGFGLLSFMRVDCKRFDLMMTTRCGGYSMYLSYLILSVFSFLKWSQYLTISLSWANQLVWLLLFTLCNSPQHCSLFSHHHLHLGIVRIWVIECFEFLSFLKSNRQYLTIWLRWASQLVWLIATSFTKMKVVVKKDQAMLWRVA